MPKPVSALISKLDSPDTAGYFAEALACYKAKAYRSCVVMIHSAVFMKLRKYVADLAELGLPGAEAALSEVVALERDKGNYESKIFAFLNREILEEDQRKFLKILQITRNDLAHASKRESSEMEARALLDDSIKYVLGPQKVRAGEFVPLLVRHLARRDFFPDRSIASVSLVVKAELSELEGEEAYARLLSQVAAAAELPGKDVRPELVGGEEAMMIASMNAEDFLCGLLSEEALTPSEPSWERRMRNAIFKRQASRKLTVKGHGYLISLISVRPSLIQDLDPAFRMRLDQLFSGIFHETQDLPHPDSSRHPGCLLQALLSRYSTEFVREHFPLTLDILIERFWSDENVAQAILDATLGEKLCGRMILHLLSCGQKGEAEAAKIVRRFDDELSAQIAAPASAKLIEAFNDVKFAGSPLQNGDFFAIPKIRNLARNYVLKEMPGLIGSLGLERVPPPTSPMERAMLRNPAAFSTVSTKDPHQDPARPQDEEGDGRAPQQAPAPS